MQNTLEETQQLHEEILKKALLIEKLQVRKEELEVVNQQKLASLKQLKKELSRTEESQEGLSNRNTALREKFYQLDAGVKAEGDKISEEMKNFFKRLGLKVVLEPATENLVELKIQFSENHDFYATFIYDSVTEDYDCKLKILQNI